MSYKWLISPNIHLLDVIYKKCNTYQHKWEEKSKSYKYFFSNLGLFLLNMQTHIYYSECLRNSNLRNHIVAGSLEQVTSSSP